jgi:hypothetical protein
MSTTPLGVLTAMMVNGTVTNASGRPPAFSAALVCSTFAPLMKFSSCALFPDAVIERDDFDIADLVGLEARPGGRGLRLRGADECQRPVEPECRRVPSEAAGAYVRRRLADNVAACHFSVGKHV